MVPSVKHLPETSDLAWSRGLPYLTLLTKITEQDEDDIESIVQSSSHKYELKFLISTSKDCCQGQVLRLYVHGDLIVCMSLQFLITP